MHITPQSLTNEPGCYIFKDSNDTIIYVGKAKNIRKRVMNYFHNKVHNTKTTQLLQHIKSVETRIVNTEEEALILENELIKQYQPKYNILLKDDKSFMYIKITNEIYPKITTVRRMIADNAFYAGPKTSSKTVRYLLTVIQKMFKIRTCKLEMQMDSSQNAVIVHNKERKDIPCMDYHIKKCTAPCANKIAYNEYIESVELAKKYLRGDTHMVQNKLLEMIEAYSTAQQFEQAARIRDIYKALEHDKQYIKQSIIYSIDTHFDVLAWSRNNNKAYCIRLIYRSGVFLEKNEITLLIDHNTTDEALLEAFILQFYSTVDSIPSTIYIPFNSKKKRLLSRILSTYNTSDKRIIELIYSKNDDIQILVEMAYKNAEAYKTRMDIAFMSEEAVYKDSIIALQKALNMDIVPKRIEGFDISHLSGTNTVASLVVFEDGKSSKNQYRRYRIKSLENGAIDDFKSMYEVLKRRFNRLSDDTVFAKNAPQLLLIDGGKGQLSSVMKAVEQYKTEHPDVQLPHIISLAKHFEEIYIPYQKEPIRLLHSDKALQLLQRIRDEAHRFAVSYQRVLRTKTAFTSVLDSLDGIGIKTKKALLKRFGSVSGIRDADEIALLEVVNKKQLESIRNGL